MLIGVHSDDGAMGVVLNRPSQLTVAEAAPQLEQAVEDAEPVYVGGPVQPSSIVFLAEFLDPSPAGLLVLGRIGFPAPDAEIDEPDARDRRARACSRASPAGARASSRRRSARATGSRRPRCREDVFTERPEQLWSDVLTRKGGSYALVARMPPDPSAQLNARPSTRG